MSSSGLRPLLLLIGGLLASVLPGLAYLGDDDEAKAKPRAEKPAARIVFSHVDHVRKGWIKDETARDCRTCHKDAVPLPGHVKGGGR